MNYQLLIGSFMAGLATAFVLMGNKRMNTIVDHTLKNPKTGEWSRKNLTGFTAFIYSMYYCQDCIVRGVAIQEFVLVIFNGTALACLGISSWEKYQFKKPSDENKPPGESTVIPG